MQFSSMMQHEAYDGNGNGFPNDIALMKLAAPLTLDNYRKPICLADADEDFVGDFNCFITGQLLLVDNTTYKY